MPIYDYVCSNCSTRTEFIHSIDAPAPRFCPACGAEDTLRKVFVPPAVVFKGSGWAKKDRSSSNGSTKARSAASGTSDGGSESKGAGSGGSGGSGAGGDAKPSTSASDAGKATASGSSSD